MVKLIKIKDKATKFLKKANFLTSTIAFNKIIIPHLTEYTISQATELEQTTEIELEIITSLVNLINITRRSDLTAN